MTNIESGDWNTIDIKESESIHGYSRANSLNQKPLNTTISPNNQSNNNRPLYYNSTRATTNFNTHNSSYSVALGATYDVQKTEINEGDIDYNDPGTYHSIAEPDQVSVQSQDDNVAIQTNNDELQQWETERKNLAESRYRTYFSNIVKRILLVMPVVFGMQRNIRLSYLIFLILFKFYTLVKKVYILKLNKFSSSEFRIAFIEALDNLLMILLGIAGCVKETSDADFNILSIAILGLAIGIIVIVAANLVPKKKQKMNAVFIFCQWVLALLIVLKADGYFYPNLKVLFIPAFLFLAIRFALSLLILVKMLVIFSNPNERKNKFSKVGHSFQFFLQASSGAAFWGLWELLGYWEGLENRLAISVGVNFCYLVALIVFLFYYRHEMIDFGLIEANKESFDPNTEIYELDLFKKKEPVKFELAGEMDIRKEPEFTNTEEYKQNVTTENNMTERPLYRMSTAEKNKQVTFKFEDDKSNKKDIARSKTDKIFNHMNSLNLKNAHQRIIELKNEEDNAKYMRTFSNPTKPVIENLDSADKREFNYISPNLKNFTGKFQRSASDGHSIVRLRSIKIEEKTFSMTDWCHICYESKPEAINMPCGHSLSCLKCANIMITRSNKCPICKKDIERVNIVKDSNEKYKKKITDTFCVISVDQMKFRK